MFTCTRFVLRVKHSQGDGEKWLTRGRWLVALESPINLCHNLGCSTNCKDTMAYVNTINMMIRIDRTKMNVKTKMIICCASHEMMKTYYWARPTNS